jgi:hypothetical protein
MNESARLQQAELETYHKVSGEDDASILTVLANHVPSKSAGKRVLEHKNNWQTRD